MPTATDTWLVRKRDGREAEFQTARIADAIRKAFRAELNLADGQPLDADAEADVERIAAAVAEEIAPLAAAGPVDVEKVQDFVELGLMRAGHYRVARAYIVYRAEHAKRRALRPVEVTGDAADAPRMSVTLEDGTRIPFDPARVRRRLAEAARGLERDVNVEELTEEVLRSMFDGISPAELDRAMILAARSRIERDPAHDTVAARLMRMVIHNEALGAHKADPDDLETLYRRQFEHYLIDGVAAGRLDPAVRTFDTARLAGALRPDRDAAFKYLGLQTIYDRYLLHVEGRRIETPQFFWMRVAMGLASAEGEAKTDRAVEFYEVLSDFRFTSATPTLFNSATLHPQLSSCYLTTVQDDLGHIFKSIGDNAALSKWAGGLGNDWTNIRATGSHIKGTNGKSQGVIPFLKIVSDAAVAVNQCFAPDTGVFTADGVKPIAAVQPGDLVLGQRGEYREVLEHFVYDQPTAEAAFPNGGGGMVEVDVKHSVHPLRITAGHPIWAVRGVPVGQTIERTGAWLEKGKVSPEWVAAGELAAGDYVAQVVPKEVVPALGLTADDARLYGVLLGDGHLAGGTRWGVSGNPSKDAHLQFVRDYLDARGVHYWESGRGETYAQIHWATGRGVLRDGTTGRIASAGPPTLPFAREDLYDADGNKRIGRRFAHLPPDQTRALLKGLLETDGGVSRGKEIYFTTTSRPLADGVRYQCLRLGVPVAGQYREREQGHSGTRSDGSVIPFEGTVKAYDLRIPAVPGVAELVGARPLTKRNWFERGGCLFTRVRRADPIPSVPAVHDLKVEGDETYMTTAALAHNGGKRKGAVCSYLETWHLDIEEFLDLRKNTGDDRRRTHDMHTANWIPDLFMQRVNAGADWTLFSPNDVPDLHDLYGKAFRERYEHYEALADRGKIALHRRLPAVDLWRKMLTRVFETGHPWITFKDPSNVRSPQDHCGVVHSSNLCTEILLNTGPDETAVCNLGSVNLRRHVTEDADGNPALDRELLADTIRTAVRMLDNVVDINFYPTPEAENANRRHRPVGLGVMGFQDALAALGISFASEEAVRFADESMEAISFEAIRASALLAAERGPYGSHAGSKWDRGLLPIDTLDLLAEERGEPIDVNRECSLDWAPVRALVAEHGMRNSNVMAIAPTATISTIVGVAQSIEPMYKHLYVKSNLSGDFTQVNLELVKELKDRGLWGPDLLEQLKYYDGALTEIADVPDDVKARYLTAFEVDGSWVLECAARRQKWIDQGQSLNLYMSAPSGKKLSDLYAEAWSKGLKTTYYLRTLAATQVEKSTVDVNKFGVQPRWMKSKSESGNVSIDRGAPPPAAADGSAPLALTAVQEGATCDPNDPTCEACQ